MGTERGKARGGGSKLFRALVVFSSFCSLEDEIQPVKTHAGLPKGPALVTVCSSKNYCSFALSSGGSLPANLMHGDLSPVLQQMRGRTRHLPWGSGAPVQWYLC